MPQASRVGADWTPLPLFWAVVLQSPSGTGVSGSMQIFIVTLFNYGCYGMLGELE